MIKAAFRSLVVILPQTAEYALRAILHIAAHEREGDGVMLRADEIATALELPRNYLAKTLHQLARAGVLASSRGPTGGFRLAVPPEHLVLEDVVSLFADRHGRRCLLGSGTCGEHPSCPVHVRWQAVATDLSTFFEHTTIADLLGTSPVAEPGRLPDVLRSPSPHPALARQEM